MRTADQVRQEFIDFFVKKHGHTAVPSAPVVPHDDPTLLFTNAGMNQFKDVFLGTGSRPYRRAVDTQKCIRAGGKHNDLDDVGKDTYHHTFFEMLGNWSFGDYFKKEAIAWAWELLTGVWGLDKSRLHATVFGGAPDEGLARDDEAAELWRTVTDIDPTHVHFFGKKDNFWEMGDTGPCGPCSEIHIDRTPDRSGIKLVNAGVPEVMEIWNLVFIQFNRNPDKSLTPLPARHVDTGMGFERVTAVLQGKTSNYDTDVFTPLFTAIQKIVGGPPYEGSLTDLRDTAYRVIADHIRALTFALTDGALPSNEGRGYVLRSILRRAVRYGVQQLDTNGPFLHKLVPAVVSNMGAAFPELKGDPKKVQDVILDEEKSFLQTLAVGINHFHSGVISETGKKLAPPGYTFAGVNYAEYDIDNTEPGEDRSYFRYVSDSGPEQRIRFHMAPIRALFQQLGVNPAELTLSARTAFKLHDTYGVFIDIVEQMAAEQGIKVDRAGFTALLEAARERSRSAQKKHVVAALQGELPRTDDSLKYEPTPIEATVVGWVKDNVVVRAGVLSEDDEVALLLDRTIFYAEQGGQVGDRGLISSDTGALFAVEDAQRHGEAVLHIGSVRKGWIRVGDRVRVSQPWKRLDTMRNHTSTHLMNLALRDVLGDHVEQKGSLVDADKTRFDFTHPQALTPEEIARVEQIVNERIQADLPVTPVTMPLAEAKKMPGVRAVFGEKYPDPVRVVMIGAETPEQATRDLSVEFCGGTHLRHTGQAGFFKIVSQEPVAKGVRRVTAVTGPRAVEAVQTLAATVDGLAARLNCRPDELPNRVEALQEEVKKLQQQLKKGAAGDLAGAADKLLAAAEEVNGTKLVVGTMPAGPTDAMRTQADRLRQKAGKCVVVLGWADEGKVSLLAAVSEELTKCGLHAGKLVGEAAKVVEGKGGGNPTLAQAGGKNAAKLGDALALAKKLAAEQLAK